MGDLHDTGDMPEGHRASADHRHSLGETRARTEECKESRLTQFQDKLGSLHEHHRLVWRGVRHRRSSLLGCEAHFLVAILPVLFLARLAAIVGCFALSTRKFGPTCFTVGAVIVAWIGIALSCS